MKEAGIASEGIPSQGSGALPPGCAQAVEWTKPLVHDCIRSCSPSLRSRLHASLVLKVLRAVRLLTGDVLKLYLIQNNYDLDERMRYLMGSECSQGCEARLLRLYVHAITRHQGPSVAAEQVDSQSRRHPRYTCLAESRKLAKSRPTCVFGH